MLIYSVPLLRVIPGAAAAAAKSRQSCPTLCGPRDGSPPGSPVPGILHVLIHHNLSSHSTVDGLCFQALVNRWQ